MNLNIHQIIEKYGNEIGETEEFLDFLEDMITEGPWMIAKHNANQTMITNSFFTDMMKYETRLKNMILEIDEALKNLDYQITIAVVRTCDGECFEFYISVAWVEKGFLCVVNTMMAALY